MFTLMLLLVLSLDPAAQILLALDADEARCLPAEPGASTAHVASIAPVTVRVGGARSDEGQALVAFFRSDDGFPRDLGRAALVASAPIEEGRAVVEADIEPGRYAVVAVHDADSDGALDTNFLGMPSEGVAVSNWQGGRPRFEPSVVEVGDGETIDLTLQYR